jgi:hypothetical protein
MQVDIAAPVIPNFGINKKFKEILIISESISGGIPSLGLP